MWPFMERVLKALELGLANQQQLRETQRMQGAVLNELLRQQNGGRRPAVTPTRLPEGTQLPLGTEDDFRNMEERLSQDDGFFEALVG